MRLVMVRHAATPGNELHRYVGRRTDEPLSDEGRAQCLREGVFPQVQKVYVSPMLRARQTASLCFPNAVLSEVPGLEEFDFGAFEGRSAQDMEQDEDYRAWVASWCNAPCPGGDSRESFVRRSNTALRGLINDAAHRHEEEVIVVAHGGTIMAALSEMAVSSAQADGYFEWQVSPCAGYAATVVAHEGIVQFEDVRSVTLGDLSFEWPCRGDA